MLQVVEDLSKLPKASFHLVLSDLVRITAAFRLNGDYELDLVVLHLILDLDGE